MDPEPQIIELGRAAYSPVHETMLRSLDEIKRGESNGVVYLVEHDPVYTAGRATDPAQVTEDVLPIERGGQITYHGPGQLVVYPIVRLPRKDLRAWLRSLEAFGVAICEDFDLAGEPSVDGTGVFVGTRKLASIGVAVRHWINLHGISINVSMDLAAFHSIRPCGLDPAIMTDLSTAAGRVITMDEARAAARANLPALLGHGD